MDREKGLRIFLTALLAAVVMAVFAGPSSSFASKSDAEKAARQQIEAAEKALKKAEEEGAEKYAKEAYQDAREILEKARKLYKEGDYERAELMAMSAEMKAKKAEAMAIEAKRPDEYLEEDAMMSRKMSPMLAPPPTKPSPAGPVTGARGGSAPPPGEPYHYTHPPAHGGTRPPNNAAYDAMFFESHGVNPFIDTEDDNLSTFAIDVDTGSYTVSRSYIFDGNLPPKEAVRVEEFVNYFKYDYPPSGRDAFSIHLEAAPSEFGGENYKLMRVGIRGKDVKVEDRKPAVLVFVIDVSGSMDREDRLGLVKKSLRILLDQLDKGDKVGIVIYGSRGEVLLEPTGLADKKKIEDAIERLGPGGATNAEEGLTLGYQMAAENFQRGSINRIILCSDGVANVGNTGAEEILKRVENFADKGITLTTVGFGMGNYNDVMMEKLADKGDGQYAYVDTLEEARRIFVENLTGTLQVIAKDVKIQVEFDEDTVARYRLLGYENRDIADEDFRNDKVDAGEIGAGHQVTALYEIKLHKGAEAGTMATVRVRWKDPDRREKVSETERTMEVKDIGGSFESASADFRLAASVAEFSEILRKSYWAKDGDLDSVLKTLQDLPRETREKDEVIELIDMVNKAEKMWESR